ncbi:MAG TPA: hypothetical protein PLX85_06125 [Dehalococcoidia bacterium]|nr:hypothetical protein [Dehalococcoidia bacterium]
MSDRYEGTRTLTDWGTFLNHVRDYGKQQIRAIPDDVELEDCLEAARQNVANWQFDPSHRRHNPVEMPTEDPS